MRYFRTAQISKILLNLTETYQRILLNIVKLILVLATLGFIVYKLFFSNDIQDIIATLSVTWTASKIILLFVILLLVIPNIALESLKWKLVMRQHEQVSWFQSLKSVTAGIALGIITPNRIGDFAGKALTSKGHFFLGAISGDQ